LSRNLGYPSLKGQQKPATHPLINMRWKNMNLFFHLERIRPLRVFLNIEAGKRLALHISKNFYYLNLMTGEYVPISSFTALVQVGSRAKPLIYSRYRVKHQKTNVGL